MEWSLEARLLIALATGALVLVAASFLFLGWRKRRAVSGANQLKSIVSSYPGMDPGMVRVMNSLLETGLVDELGRQEDVQKALQSLSTHFGERPKRSIPGSVLSVPDRSEPSDGGTIDPALVTILRAAYFSPKVSEKLPAEAVKELDHLLDSLTQQAPSQ